MDGSEKVKREDGSLVKVGDRVESEGVFATIRYIGQVPPTKGTWLGVEWDDPSRGKHDGAKDGNRYFNTMKPTAGSFVRPKKVSLGVPYLSAVVDRYGKISEENAGVNTEELYVRGAANQKTFLEMVGANRLNEKQSQLDQLLEAGLRDMAVYGPGLDGNLADLTPNLAELDLSRNLVSCWEDVAGLASQLPRLRLLNVSENKLSIPSDPARLSSSFPALTTLFLNRMNYDWSQILQLLLMFPHLRHLHVCYNDIQQLSSPGGRLSNLELLNLEANSIKSWDEIIKLGCLSQLRTLILNGNEIDSIHFPCDNGVGKTELFPKLKSLSVSHNRISKWRSLSELNKLRGLEQLSAKENPVISAESEANTRQWLIAKIASLKLYSRSEVTAKERKGAEIDYLKKFGKDWLEAGGNQDPQKNQPSAAFLSEHPRYMELVSVYGAPEDSELKEESKTLKDNLISLKICSVLDDREVQKKLPLTMSIQKLKTLTQRLFKVGSGDVRLSYISQKMKGPEIEMDNDLRQLSFYSVENNDTIKVCW